MQKQKIEELIPSLIRQISNGEGISVAEVAKRYKVSADGVKKRLREVRDTFYKNAFGYDGSTKKWVVKSGQLGFLQRELLEPEEAVVLTAMSRTKDRLGKGLVATHEKIVNNYTKRAKSYIFKQHKAEEITEDMEQTFALLKYAINNKNIIQLDYPSKGMLKTRRVFPYRIVYIEYYWYLICYEDGEKIKSFRLSLIKSASILNKVYKYDFENVDLRLKLAMNAFVDYKASIQTVEILVNDFRTNHIELASFFAAWKKTDYIIEINGIQYRRFEVKITNPEYKDIIPTILKYMPEMLVESPEALKEAIQMRVESYLQQYEA